MAMTDLNQSFERFRGLRRWMAEVRDDDSDLNQNFERFRGSRRWMARRRFKSKPELRTIQRFATVDGGGSR
ncbi:hypothetical protein U1Q18_005689 [Sarracenia purpurea var. burkii]